MAENMNSRPTKRFRQPPERFREPKLEDDEDFERVSFPQSFNSAGQMSLGFGLQGSAGAIHSPLSQPLLGAFHLVDVEQANASLLTSGFFGIHSNHFPQFMQRAHNLHSGQSSEKKPNAVLKVAEKFSTKKKGGQKTGQPRGG